MKNNARWLREWVAPAVVMVAITAPCYAVTGNELLAQLQSKNASENLRAFAYIQGVMDYESILVLKESLEQAVRQDKSAQRPARLICPPQNATNKQLFDLVQRNLEENPATRHEDAFGFIRRAGLEAWPCAMNTRPSDQ